MNELLQHFEGTKERVGFILGTGEIVECLNVSLTPEVAFAVSADDLMLYADVAVSTWHTHPKSDNNLSLMDFDMFRTWSTLSHFIVGTNGVKKYVIVDGEVLIA